MKTISNRIVKTALISWRELKWFHTDLKKLPRESFEKLKQSLISNNFVQPFNVWQLGRTVLILDGQYRMKAMQALEKEGYEIPDLLPANFIQCKNRADAARMVLLYSSIYANITESGLDSFAQVNNLDIPALSLEINLPDFKLDEYLQTTGDAGDTDLDIDEIPEPPKDPRTRPGDLYELGPHRLLCGDATNPDHISRLMGLDVAKLIFTSPPYNMAGGMYKEYSDNMKSAEYIDFNLRTISAWQRYLKGYLFWNISYNKNSRWEFIEIMYRIVKETGLTFLELILWDKGTGYPIYNMDALTRQYEDILLTGDEESIHQELDLFCISTTGKRAWFNKRTGKGVTNYWRINTSTEKVQLGNHLACFPVALPSRAIRLMSNINDIVCDPFGGSGSTLIACEQLSRRCRLMELSPVYCDVIVTRWCQYTGNKIINLNKKKVNL